MSKVTAVGEILDTKSESLNSESISKKGKGGARVGAGRPKGKLDPHTLEQMAVREDFNQLTMRAATKLFNAQFGLAVGTQTLFVKYHVGSGKERKTVVETVTDEHLIKEYLIDDGLSLNADGDDEYYYISNNPANNNAIDSMLNRALGKAPDKLEITGGFFTKQEMTIKVVGSDHDIIDIGDDGQIVGGTSADPVGETGPSDESPQPPTSS